MSEKRIALSDLDYGPEEEAAVLRVLKSRWLSMGPEVQAFEREFSGFLNVKHAVAVANATAGLHLAFLALGLGPGDEVIQPALNFVAAANMTVACGATPVFADVISLCEPTIDPLDVDRLVTAKTKAIVAMHYGGYPCRMVELVAVCQRNGLALVEDACHAVGARYIRSGHGETQSRMVGGVGDVGVFSFFSNKNLATGEGGMVVTDNDDVAECCRSLRSHGMTSLTWDRHRGHAQGYDVRRSGFNYRIDEIRAAIGREQLKKLEYGNSKRREFTNLYHELLADIPDITLPFRDWNGDFSGHLMPLVAKDVSLRTEIADVLLRGGVQTSRHYPDIRTFSAFDDGTPWLGGVTREFCSRVISLPLFASMHEQQVRTVARLVGAACHGVA